MSRSPLRSSRRLVESRESSGNLGTYVAYRFWKPRNLVKVPECLPDSDLRPKSDSLNLVEVFFRQQSQEHFYKWVQKPCGLSAISIGFLGVTSADWIGLPRITLVSNILTGFLSIPELSGL